MNKMKTLISIAFLCFFSLHANAQSKGNVAKKPVVAKTGTAKPAVKSTKPVKLPGVRVKITTDSGVIVLRLYDETPLHRDNFVKLVKEKYFDSLLFHRVMNQFMIQGGDPQSKHAAPGEPLGSGGTGYTIPAEFDTLLYHKKGALAAARMPDEVNPAKESSGCQFYIVQGKQWADNELYGVQARRGTKYTDAQRNMYRTVGGFAPLDMNYTVFGEVESGLEVVDKIASVPVDYRNRPFGDIRMYIELIK